MIFVRRYWYLSSISEIATEYELTQSKVKSVLFRIRNKLKPYFEKVGKILTIDKNMLTDDLLLFIGKENVNINDMAQNMKITIRATATFNDGKTQEEIITLDYSNVESVIVAGFTEEDMQRWNRENTESNPQYDNEDAVGAGYVAGRGVIGVATRDVDAEEAKRNGLPRAGVMVMEVLPSSGAELAGIELHDVILSCNGKDIKSVNELNAMCNSFKAGQTITLHIDRNGVEMDMDVTLTPYKQDRN